MTDIRQILENAEDPSKELDTQIWEILQSEFPRAGLNGYEPLTSSYDLSITVMDIIEFDWVMASINGYMGGTPYADVGSVKSNHDATPLLSLWLGVMRQILGDERE